MGAMLASLLSATAFGSALTFGFRHGFDWDHLAALTDLTGSQARPRRAMWLASLYVAGHAVMVLVLGAIAILFAEQVPTAVDSAMEVLVGLTLVALGLWIVGTAIRTRGVPPLRSRWMVVLAGVRRLGAARRGRGEELVVIEHDHPHDHGHALHEHLHRDGELDGEVVVDATGTAESPTATSVAVGHSHVHRHVLPAPADPFATYSSPSAFGIGLIHGVGAETPTQVLVFATAANASGRPTSLGILGCFVVGLVAANTVVAAASAFGFNRVVRRPAVALVLAAVTATFSLVVGTMLLTGHGGALPPFPGS